jgi:hypothetical protein
MGIDSIIKHIKKILMTWPHAMPMIKTHKTDHLKNKYLHIKESKIWELQGIWLAVLSVDNLKGKLVPT